MFDDYSHRNVAKWFALAHCRGMNICIPEEPRPCSTSRAYT
jgi:hypothetical protein